MPKLSLADFELLKASRDQLAEDLRQNEAEAFSYLTREEAHLLYVKLSRLDALIRADDKTQLH